MVVRRNKHMGSSLDDFLKEEGVFEEFQAAAIKKVIAWQVDKAMKAQQLTKVRMARNMKTSRAQLDRLLNPDDGNVSIETLQRAATALGQELRINFGPSTALKASRKRPRRAA